MFSRRGFLRTSVRKIKNRIRYTRKVKKVMESVENVIGWGEVFDYVSWAQAGGAERPVPAKGTEKCFVWFVPDWSNVWGGGHYTLFRFANHFARKGTRQIIYVYNNRRHSNPTELQKTLDGALPNCKLEVVVSPDKLPACEVALATTWQSAYFVRAFPFANNKFYFMQDYECQFYSYGTASMQAANSYTFGFKGVTGGQWNRKQFESHGGKAEHYIFSTDRDIFYPNEKNGVVREKVKRLFFYGRPTTERRCFELGVASLAKVAKKYPDIEIVLAGLDIGGVMPFKATMQGNLTLKATGDLYRTCDIGLAFSGTNLSYLPVELMASGVPVISNNGPHVDWYCDDGINSLLVDPTPASVLEAVTKLVESKPLRQSLVDSGLKKTAERTWESEMDRIFAYIEHECAQETVLPPR
mgnify:CR=1 FL=1